MSIPVKKEPAGEARKYRGELELCHFCRRTTQYWHIPTNTPVCEPCAETHDATEIKD